MVQTWIFAANTYGRVAARLARVPVVVTAEMAVDLWKGPGELAIDRRLARWTDRVVGNSHAVVDFYRQAGVPDDRLAMIYSGIDDEEPPAGRPGRGPRRASAGPATPRWSSSPAGWPRRRGSTTCSRRSTCSSTSSPTFAP